MVRFITGHLWRFVLFRYAVVLASSHGPQWLGALLFRHTPFGEQLHRLFLDQGDMATAAECARELRRR